MEINKPEKKLVIFNAIAEVWYSEGYGDLKKLVDSHAPFELSYSTDNVVVSLSQMDDDSKCGDNKFDQEVNKVHIGLGPIVPIITKTKTEIWFECPHCQQQTSHGLAEPTGVFELMCVECGEFNEIKVEAKAAQKSAVASEVSDFKEDLNKT